MKKLILISVYKVLRFFTTKTFDFILSGSMFGGIALLFNSLPISLFLLVSHLLFFKYLNPLIRKEYQTDLSYSEYTSDIENIYKR